jgi:hypothetical protein
VLRIVETEVKFDLTTIGNEEKARALTAAEIAAEELPEIDYLWWNCWGSLTWPK